MHTMRPDHRDVFVTVSSKLQLRHLNGTASCSKQPQGIPTIWHLTIFSLIQGLTDQVLGSAYRTLGMCIGLREKTLQAVTSPLAL